jgi:4-hydroxy-3-methylbut-2-enyl diphosphate reductase
VVIGAANSSNSNRLRELAAESGTPSVLLEDSRALDWDWLAGVGTLGVTAGASAPEKLVTELLEAIAARMPVEVEALAGIEESIRFRLPAEVA